MVRFPPPQNRTTRFAPPFANCQLDPQSSDSLAIRDV